MKTLQPRPAPSHHAARRLVRSLGHVLTVLIVAGLGALSLTGCASTGESGSLAARVTMRQFGTKEISFELRSESHTDALEYYSSARQRANVKIIADGLMDGLLRDLDALGFDRYANPGPGPSSGLGGASKVVEVEIDGRVRHAASHPNADSEQINAVVQMVVFVSNAFSSVHGFQSVEDARSSSVFSGPGLDG